MSNETTPEAYFAQFGEIETVKRTRFQKIVAKTMTANASTIPHVTHQDDADVTGLMAYRETMAPGTKVSPLIFLIKAVVEALKAYPQFNASLTPDGETLVLKKFFHIGIAVDGPLGLLVPVLRDADQKDIQTLAAELKDVSALARSKGLPLDKMQGGCFSISSLGGIGGTYFTPIINAPEVAILGVTGVQTRPVWNGHEFLPRQILPLSLSYDHRVINGADAARFVRKIAAGLTQWDAA
ncbi:MAG TPA: 2-oxo acid dehydrogenase subunit E2 [Acidocella sp.]|nr:2-oxo acid dehydrogenase subunit E2 [Acidocella sp.]